MRSTTANRSLPGWCSHQCRIQWRVLHQILASGLALLLKYSKGIAFRSVRTRLVASSGAAVATGRTNVRPSAKSDADQVSGPEQ
jgi:hypothetical protein